MYGIGLENYHTILVSDSRSRQELLAGTDIAFSLHPTRIEVIIRYISNIKRSHTTYQNSRQYLSPLRENEIVIAANTIIWFKERALEKPQTKKEIFTMLQNLSEKTHKVITSIFIRSLVIKERFYDTTQVRFKYLTEKEIHYYIKNYPPLDKTGVYGIHK
ncbi:MAG: Maf family protein [Flavobacteriales bacterium]